MLYNDLPLFAMTQHVLSGVRHGNVLCFTMMCRGLSWRNVVYDDMSWLTMGYRGVRCSFVVYHRMPCCTTMRTIVSVPQASLLCHACVFLYTVFSADNSILCIIFTYNPLAVLSLVRRQRGRLLNVVHIVDISR